MNQMRIMGYSNYPIPYLDIDRYEFDKELIKQFSKELLLQFNFIPLDICGNILTAVVSFPCIELIKDLELLSGKKVRIFWSKDCRINENIKRLKEKSSNNHPDTIIWDDNIDRIKSN